MTIVPSDGVIVLPVPRDPSPAEIEVMYHLWLRAAQNCAHAYRMARVNNNPPAVIRQCQERYSYCQSNAIGWASR